MDDITSYLLLLLLLLLQILPLTGTTPAGNIDATDSLVLADGQTCHDPIRVSGKQQRSSIYCSSCLTYVNGKLSAPAIQLELPALTQLTGIVVQQAYANEQGSSVRPDRCSSDPILDSLVSM